MADEQEQPHRGPGRPRKTADEDKVRRLAAKGCTMEEIASAVGMCDDTLRTHYSAVIKKGREQGNRSLRRMQWEAAKSGSIPMQIWLGKQLLGQKDKSDVTSGDQPLRIEVVYRDKPRADPDDQP